MAYWFARTRPPDLYVSVITILELEVGILRISRRDPIQGSNLRRWYEERVLTEFAGRILAVDQAVARRAAALHVPDPGPERDTLIAATALTHGMTLVTRNVSDMRAEGLALINPWVG